MSTEAFSLFMFLPSHLSPAVQVGSKCYFSCDVRVQLRVLAVVLRNIRFQNSEFQII